MSKPLTETITVSRPVNPRIADLVHFAREAIAYHEQRKRAVTDAEPVSLANRFWDRQHGED